MADSVGLYLAGVSYVVNLSQHRNDKKVNLKWRIWKGSFYGLVEKACELCRFGVSVLISYTEKASDSGRTDSRYLIKSQFKSLPRSYIASFV